ncbi:restriction endonuclease subunit S [Methylobacterium sp. Leaf89]|uniref:restriction endonuclease subunit S n=1 Tax=Methylobacterium sp. Leaf89 TaxID=1736245 RepID=UPI0009E8D584|nr:restriction endonuclease subunit S [Methylobacterium sp. Leaf89]
MNEWITISLGEICDKGGGEIRTGPFGSQLHEADYSSDGIPVVMPKDIPSGKVDEATIARIPVDLVHRLSQHVLKEGDIVYGRRGDIGRKALITAREAGWLCGTGCLRITPGVGIVDPRFLFYRLGAPETVSAIANQAVGATMPNLNSSILRGVSVTLPSLATQGRIASILEAYDDLIEVNRQRVVLLENMARSLFEEWFVRFRFPGHEAGKIVDTPDGPRPEAWKHVRLDDVLVLQRGFDLPTSARSPGPFFVISASGRHGAHAEAKVKGPGVVTGRSGTIGKVHLVLEDHWPLNTTLYVKEFKRGGPAFASLLLRHLDLATSSSGAAVPTLNRNHVHGLPIAVPPNDFVDRFEDVAMSWLRLAHNLRSQIERLAVSRDLLLPRLISGQLLVAAAEREQQEAA